MTAGPIVARLPTVEMAEVIALAIAGLFGLLWVGLVLMVLVVAISVLFSRQ